MSKYPIRCPECDQELFTDGSYLSAVPYPIRCPKCDQELFTDGSYLSAVPDKPDPEGDKIMKAAETWRDLLNPRLLTSHEPSDRGAFLDLARLIQAGIQKNTEGIEAVEKEIKEVDKRRYEGHLAFLEERQHLYDKIEAVRKLFRNHEKRITELSAWQTIYQVIIDQLPSQVRVYDLERKVDKLEDKVEDTEDTLMVHAALLSPKPHPSLKDPWAWDEDHEEKHPLIPRVSVIRGISDRVIIFSHLDEGDSGFAWGPAIWPACYSGELRQIDLKRSTFLFNLDFPGGDK